MKKINNKTFEYSNIFKKYESIIFLKLSILIIICFILFGFYFFNNLSNLFYNEKIKSKYFSLNHKTFEENFEYHNYERDLITDKIKKYAGYQPNRNESYFLNGIIRKFKPKRCLEIGVAKGGSSIIILNAIKDSNNSFLISLDISPNYKLSSNSKLKTGFLVYKYFPELISNKWKMFTGRQPHIYLSQLKIKFDFLFLDTVHLAPGEYINFIEVLPFLEENAIIVLHDVMFHLPSFGYYNPKSIKFHPSNIYLFSSIVGNKIIIPNENNSIENIGAVILDRNQENNFLNYFLLLLSPWDYLPNKSYINELRIFIKKYYIKDVYLFLFNKSYEENELYVKKHQSFFNHLS